MPFCVSHICQLTEVCGSVTGSAVDGGSGSPVVGGVVTGGSGVVGGSTVTGGSVVTGCSGPRLITRSMAVSVVGTASPLNIPCLITVPDG